MPTPPASACRVTIAATAEKNGLTVVAAGKDFDLIAAITGQPIDMLPD